MDNSNKIILFLHIPKSAGTTLASCLTENYYNRQCDELQLPAHEDLHRFYEGDMFYYPIGFYKDPKGWYPEYIIPFLNLPGLRVVTGHFSYGIHHHIPAECLYFTILRDPIKRIVSLYYHLVSTKVINEKISLDQFLEGIPEEGWLADLIKWHPVHAGLDESNIRKWSRCMVDNDQTRRISGMEPPFGELSESMFLNARTNIDNNFILVGLTERFDETLLLLAIKLGWAKLPNYLPKLVNRAKQASETLHDRVLYKIEELNYWDIKLYDYARRLFEQTVEEYGLEFKTKIRAFKQTNEMFLASHKDVSAWDIGVKLG
jgi:hypothetical protein